MNQPALVLFVSQPFFLKNARLMTNKFLLGSFSAHVAVKENFSIMNMTETPQELSFMGMRTTKAPDPVHNIYATS